MYVGTCHSTCNYMYGHAQLVCKDIFEANFLAQSGHGVKDEDFKTLITKQTCEIAIKG